MKPAHFLIAAAAMLFSGCAVQTKEQLAAVRAAGVSPSTLQKLERRGVLTPEDLIELKRKRVSDGVALRQLDRVGVDYVVNKRDVQKMRDQGVSKVVVAATIESSERFLRRLYRPDPGYPYPGWGGPWGYPHPYDPFFHHPWYPYGGVGFGYYHHRWR